MGTKFVVKGSFPPENSAFVAGCGAPGDAYANGANFDLLLNFSPSNFSRTDTAIKFFFWYRVTRTNYSPP